MPPLTSDPVTRLQRWVRLGQVVLFTGAGFSRGATDLSGRAVPQVGDLRHELWEMLYPGTPYEDGADLGDLYENALSRSRRAVTALLKSRLDIDPASLDNHYARWLSVPWRIAYTLNIDNLEEASEFAFDLPRRIKSFSALTEEMPLGGGGDLPYVHLNGTLADLPEVTFGPAQYGSRLAREEPLYARLVTDLLTYPVVFVGTELREPTFWSYLALRGKKGERGVDESRPRSFLVSPTLPPEREELLATYNIAWVPMSAEEFAGAVLAPLEEESAAGLQEIAARAHLAKQRVQMLSVIDLMALPYPPDSEFLLGARPTWGDIASERAVPRDFEQEVDTDVLPRVLVVTGTAGAGTSTTMMRIAARVAASGRRALWVSRNPGFAAHEVSRALGDLEGDAVVFIDDADSLGRRLSQLLSAVAGEYSNINLVIGLRSGRLDDVLEGWQPDDVQEVELIVPPLENSDVDRLLDALDRDNKLGELKGLDRTRQASVLIRECNRQLLVAMLKATSGVELEEKVRSELRALEQPQRDQYAALAIATSLRHTLSRDEVLTAADAMNNTGVTALDRMVARRLVIREHEGYELRHRLVAEVAVGELRQSGDSFKPYRGLSRVLAAKHRPGDRTSRTGRFVIALISHRRIHSFFDTPAVRELYQSLEEFLHDDYHFLLQRGGYELDHGSVPLARNYLQQARQLGAGDYRVETEWAHFLMKMAIADPRAADAEDLVAEAEQILLDQIAAIGDRDHHAYHMYGSQMLAWIHRAALSHLDRQVLYKRVLEIVDQGAAQHPRDQDITSLAERIKREYLLTATH